MNIIGLDIGRGSAVLCCLDRFPVNIQQHYKKLKNSQQFYKIKTDAAGVNKLLSLKPDAIVLEPTGHWYSHFWVSVAKAHHIKIYWIGHCDLDKQRGSYGFTNKRDEEDALCLAASYFDDRFIDEHGNKRFLNYYYDENESLVRIRELFLEKEQLQKLRSNLIAQLRQRLAFEFPEIVKSKMKISPVRGFTPIIAWLAGIHQDKRYENKYKLSVAHQLGITISDYTVRHSKIIIDVELRITKHYHLLEQAIARPEFEPYLRVFDRFGFGLDNKVLLLYHCYPFEKFLSNGKPLLERERKNNKWQKRDRSLRKFQAFLGMSFSYQQSGNTTKRKFHGSSIVRSHLYIWAVCMVAPSKHGYRISGDIGRQLSDRYQALRTNVNGKDSLTRILFKVTRMLFYELFNELIC